MLASCRPMMETEGSGFASGSTPKCHGSATLLSMYLFIPNPPLHADPAAWFWGRKISKAAIFHVRFQRWQLIMG